MYEYRTESHYMSTPPSILTPPLVASGPKFRLRAMQFVPMSKSETHNISYGGPNGTPYSTSSNGSVMGQWIVIWERYVPDQENE